MCREQASIMTNAHTTRSFPVTGSSQRPSCPLSICACSPASIGRGFHTVTCARLTSSGMFAGT
jgi:hypothetical protein